ncbi:MAG: glycogen/starch/alpha-glucan family phosphorylase [Clostridia bacterium]|nr:glycogen/starch/alpha-glucan family phosphorylase [Clostridia bacterium]
MNIEELIELNCQERIEDCSDEQLYLGLLRTVMEMSAKKHKAVSRKRLYYISAEFLIGKLLGNNLMNLGIYDDVKQALKKHGRELSDIEEFESEPSLGNGGLGRLAACFLDSIATLNLPGDGIGINYHFGLFKQKFCHNMQKEEPNTWLDSSGFLRKQDVSYEITFGDFKVKSRLYNLDVIGYGGSCNKLHLFDLEDVDESLVGDGIEFDKTKTNKNLSLFLYPDDSDEDGKLLRLYQQYFMVSSAAQLIIDEAKERGSKLSDLDEYAVIQINDTHPSMIIPELIRLLVDKGIDMDTAIDVVTKTCAYTNHTILAEALEKWPVSYIKKVAPQLLPIIEVLDNRIRRKYGDSSVYIIDENELVNMARMDIHYTFSTNGVAKLHTEILKHNELNSFYKIYPERFNNKTNGITFRRWLLYSNPHLTSYIESLIGDGFKKDGRELKKLLGYTEDSAVLENIGKIKKKNKEILAEYLLKTQGIIVDPESIFDMQIKRLHEYKRQQMNILYVIDKYLKIKAGQIPEHPITVIFGAKAAPAYTIAKDIIHLILSVSQLINNDKEVSKYLKVVMVENYNVTLAEKLIPACDISEQISLASKEASGTGNMKFMLSGAVTLGTEDGANVEIHKLVGDENIYIFGDDSNTVIKRYKEKSYKPQEYLAKNKELKTAVDFILGKELLQVGDEACLKNLQRELTGKDWFMTFPDFEDYKKTRERAYKDYLDRENWQKKMLINIANAGYFSSDRTIDEYNRDIWKL